jgi:cytochrome c553
MNTHGFGRILSLVALGLLMTVSQYAAAGKSTVENGYLYVPRVDVENYGSLELVFRVVFDSEYKFLLESAESASESIENSGVFDSSSNSIALDEVEVVEGGRTYSVEIEQLEHETELLFGIVAATEITAPGTTSGSSQPSPGPQQPASASSTLFNQQCASCHGGDGAGTAIAPSLIACASCSSYSTLLNTIANTMPLGQPDACDADCSAALAEYIQTTINSSNEAVVADTVGFIELLGNGVTLRKASEQLLSRLPTLDEFRMVATDGNAGLRQAIEQMMEEEAFYRRLSEIFNDYLLTDKYHSRNGSEAAISLLSSDDFPSRRWFDPGKDNRDDNYSTVRRQTNDGIAREPLALINHVVKNDLPFTEILTADYMMMSPMSARSYGVSGIPFSNPNDPDEFRPGRLEGIPHAGILTSPMFLNRYPTTSTNRNRGRARVVFDLFLDTDILAIEGVRPGNAVDITTPIPTINNPQCSKCHSVLDPVASVFQNWDYKGRYRPSREKKGGWYTDMEPRGFNGQVMPLAGNVDSSVRWLAHEIAADPKFPRAVTRILVNGLTGKEPLQAPTGDDATQAEMDAYTAERSLLNDLQASFVADNYNLKTLVREIMMSPYWRAAGISDANGLPIHQNTGSSYLLSPEQLDRKILSLFGFDWRNSLDQYYKDHNKSWASKLERTFHQIYGGIDSDSVTTRLKSPNGLMGAMQLRMANELACYAVPHDFWLPEDQRRLFLYVDKEVNPYDEQGNLDPDAVARIRQNIRFLHEYILGEPLALESSEVSITLDLYMTVLNQGRQYLLNNAGEWWAVRLPSMCDRTRDFNGVDLKDVNGQDLSLQRDNQFVIRAWMAVVAYLLADYRFLYG